PARLEQKGNPHPLAAVGQIPQSYSQRCNASQESQEGTRRGKERHRRRNPPSRVEGSKQRRLLIMTNNASVTGMEFDVPASEVVRDVPQGEIKLETRIPINGVEDIVKARKSGRFLAEELGFSMTHTTLVV